MSNVPSTYDDEIDLLGIIQTIWEGKWKIASTIAFFLVSVFGFTILIPNTNFTATTKIKPITSFEFDKYRLFNSSLKIIKNIEGKDNIFEITSETLLKLYLEQIEEGSLLETAVEKFNLINKSDYDSDSDYKEAIEKFVSYITILRPKKENNFKTSHHVLKVEYDDKNKWKNLLSFVNKEANIKVKASLINRFATIVSIQNQKQDFALKDIDIKIQNVKNDYDRIAKDRIAFLTEQAAIARKLNIQKNTIASQRFNTQNSFVTNVKTDAPFYLRGYIAIEEEIYQIKNRDNKSAFIKNLYRLEQDKRDVEQDKTIIRAIELFNKTPLNEKDFQATIVKVATTDFRTKTNKSLYYALAIVIGGIIGIFYVLVAKAYRDRIHKTVSS